MIDLKFRTNSRLVSISNEQVYHILPELQLLKIWYVLYIIYIYTHIFPTHSQSLPGIGTWSTLLLNVCDLSRFSPTQKDQVTRQRWGLYKAVEQPVETTGFQHKVVPPQWCLLVYNPLLSTSISTINPNDWSYVHQLSDLPHWGTTLQEPCLHNPLVNVYNKNYGRIHHAL